MHSECGVGSPEGLSTCPGFKATVPSPGLSIAVGWVANATMPAVLPPSWQHVLNGFSICLGSWAHPIGVLADVVLIAPVSSSDGEFHC